ncbi:hypothetical protein KP509_31G056800 [Ceratopteris richardii]|uniref:Uncharacterized protein n=1 Tax=Ceratopteris richardii TaxID=49495 RepID=A0A8T2QYC3_CERRI|nr:hypothetical protein KP509_31G056800 [Ceratopteris richardii]
MAEAAVVTETPYIHKVPKHIYEKQKYFQSICDKPTYLRGPHDRFSSFLIPTKILLIVSVLMGRRAWDLTRGTTWKKKVLIKEAERRKKRRWNVLWGLCLCIGMRERATSRPRQQREGFFFLIPWDSSLSIGGGI